jgi:hypothetical protein
MRYITEEKRKLFSSYFSAIANARDGQLEALKENASQYPWLVNTARDEVTRHFPFHFYFCETFQTFDFSINKWQLSFILLIVMLSISVL